MIFYLPERAGGCRVWHIQHWRIVLQHENRRRLPRQQQALAEIGAILGRLLRGYGINLIWQRASKIIMITREQARHLCRLPMIGDHGNSDQHRECRNKGCSPTFISRQKTRKQQAVQNTGKAKNHRQRRQDPDQNGQWKTNAAEGKADSKPACTKREQGKDSKNDLENIVMAHR